MKLVTDIISLARTNKTRKNEILYTKFLIPEVSDWDLKHGFLFELDVEVTLDWVLRYPKPSVFIYSFKIGCDESGTIRKMGYVVGFN